MTGRCSCSFRELNNCRAGAASELEPRAQPFLPGTAALGCWCQVARNIAVDVFLPAGKNEAEAGAVAQAWANPSCCEAGS